MAGYDWHGITGPVTVSEVRVPETGDRRPETGDRRLRRSPRRSAVSGVSAPRVRACRCHVRAADLRAERRIMQIASTTGARCVGGAEWGGGGGGRLLSYPWVSVGCLKVVVHWLRVSAVIAEFNMGCHRCYGLGASARTY